MATQDAAVDAFAAFAPFYEQFSRAYRHDHWLAELTRLARRHGLRGRDVLDVACGTGKSTAALVALGFSVAGCDISTEMLDVARDLVPDVDLYHADMRRLPDLGTFSWITCINDAVNYLLDDHDLVRAFRAMRARLLPGGLLTFDLTSPGAHRRIYTESRLVQDDDVYICWHGRGLDQKAGVVGRGDVVIFQHGDGGWDRVDSHHVQRLWTSDDVLGAAEQTGLDVVAIYGQRPGCIIEPEVHDGHAKVVYYLRRPVDDASEAMRGPGQACHPPTSLAVETREGGDPG